MRVRRADTGRTAAVLPRGMRKTRSATALLLSFALLCGVTAIGGPTLTPRGMRGNQLTPLTSASIIGSTLASTASLTNPSPQAPLPAHAPKPRVHPKHVAAALNPESSNSTAMLASAPDIPGLGMHAATSSRIAEDARATFLSFASNSSRTRGQPVSG